MAWSTRDIPDLSGRVAVARSLRNREAMTTLWEVSERETGIAFEVKLP